MGLMRRTRSGDVEKTSFSYTAKLNKSGSSVSFSSVKWAKEPIWCQPFPAAYSAYEFIEKIGSGASATVWLAKCTTLNYTKVAIKIIDLDRFTSNLDVIIKEAKVMREQRHPHMVPLLASFVEKCYLYMVMPFIEGGSITGIMERQCPEGLDEELIATIILPVLEALHYMHQGGCIHRDVKADNILIDRDGFVFLADFGVTAMMERVELGTVSTSSSGSSSSGSLQSTSQTSISSLPWTPSRSSTASDASSSQASPLREPLPSPTSVLPRNDSVWSRLNYLKRNTFVGTPNFMAPEIIQHKGYHQSADIWSLGIVLLELAMGQAPYADYSLVNIMMMTLHSPPPKLTSTPRKKYSDALVHLVSQCLQKDADARPTAAQLLQHPFFKLARDEVFLADELLATGSSRQGSFKSTSTEPSKSPVLRTTSSGGSSGGGSSSGPRLGNPAKSIGRLANRLTGYVDKSVFRLQQEIASSGRLLKMMTQIKRYDFRKYQIPVQKYATCGGVAFATITRLGMSHVGIGQGFVISRVEDNGQARWSGPMYFDITVVEGMVRNHQQLEVTWVVPSAEGMQWFLQDVIKGQAAPMSKDVELGQANRSELLKELQDRVAPETFKQAQPSGGQGSQEISELDLARLHAWEWKALGVADQQHLAEPCAIPLRYARININPEANERMYGRCSPSQILTGAKEPPSEFDPLYQQLSALQQGMVKGAVNEHGKMKKSLLFKLGQLVNPFTDM